MQSFSRMLMVLALFLIAVSIVLLLVPREKEVDTVACTADALTCPDGSTVGRVGPECSFAPCPSTSTNTPPVATTPDDIDAHIASKSDLIVVTTPARDARISSPVTIRGMARGYWFFEASFPITIVDWNGKIIGESIATAEGEWMTEEFVPFTAKVSFDLPEDTPYRRGAIILKKDNPSGLPQNDDALELPITF